MSITKKEANKLRGKIAAHREASLNTLVEIEREGYDGSTRKQAEEQENRFHDELYALIRELTEQKK